jgi:hypothetical protein
LYENKVYCWFIFYIGVLLTGPVFGGGGQQEQKKEGLVEEPYWTPQGYDYNKLVEAAKKEGCLTVRWHPEAPHPNAARLWARWVLTQKGHQPWSDVIGGFSPNSTVPAAANPFGSWDKWIEKLLIIDEVKSSQIRQDLQDLFMINR